MRKEQLRVAHSHGARRFISELKVSFQIFSKMAPPPKLNKMDRIDMTRRQSTGILKNQPEPEPEKNTQRTWFFLVFVPWKLRTTRQTIKIAAKS